MCVCVHVRVCALCASVRVCVCVTALVLKKSENNFESEFSPSII